MKKTVILVANTGMGNIVLEQLLQISDIKVSLVITNKYKGTYPYYRIKELYRFSKTNRIPTLCNVDVNSPLIINQIKKTKADYVVVASFNQIFKKELLICGPEFINFHPSLLPYYRGPSPIHWVLLNNENETGVTAHYMDEKIDKGVIIDKIKIKIEKKDTINVLIKKVHKSAGLLAKTIFQNDIFSASQNIKNTDEGAYYKRPVGLDIIKDSDSFDTVINKIRVFGFFPGIVHKDKRIKIRRIKIQKKSIIIIDNFKNEIKIF